MIPAGGGESRSGSAARFPRRKEKFQFFSEQGVDETYFFCYTIKQIK